MANSYSIADRRIETFRRAASRKRRYIFGFFISLLFIAVGFFISEIIIIGGLLIMILSLMNIAACNFAAKQLRRMEAEQKTEMPPSPDKDFAKVEEMACSFCGKKTPANSKFCEQCGKKLG